jgi:hypothetical protein
MAAVPDVGALLAKAFARPIARFVGGTPEEVRGEVTAAPDSAPALVLSALYRFVAWMFAGGVCFVVAIVAAVTENAIAGPPARLTAPFVLPPMIVCLLTGVLSSLRMGIGWYVTPARWKRAGRVLRWLVTPGNRDLVIALVLVALVDLAVSTA